MPKLVTLDRRHRWKRDFNDLRYIRLVLRSFIFAAFSKHCNVSFAFYYCWAANKHLLYLSNFHFFQVSILPICKIFRWMSGFAIEKCGIDLLGDEIRERVLIEGWEERQDIILMRDLSCACNISAVWHNIISSLLLFCHVSATCYRQHAVKKCNSKTPIHTSI